jgi:tetratricopeptide (TPR) repeat protein
VLVDGQKSAEVTRWLRKARATDKDAREANYVEALLELRDGKKLPATRALRALVGDAGALGDVRPAYRLALIEFGDKAYDAARDGAKQVLAVQPGHAGATALMSRIDTATAVVTTDPMPPEQPSNSGSSSSGSSSSGSSSSSSGGGGGYDALLERADKKAEAGDCRSARELYQKALDANPVGVAALTGLGYCHIEAREFASAQAKFRAALSISSRYQDALLGVAEAYQQQGLKPQAIDAYKKFIEEHPSSPRAATARRQIEKLGGGTSGDSGGGTTGSGTSGDTGDTTGTDSVGGGDKPAPTPPPGDDDDDDDDDPVD